MFPSEIVLPFCLISTCTCPEDDNIFMDPAAFFCLITEQQRARKVNRERKNSCRTDRFSLLQDRPYYTEQKMSNPGVQKNDPAPSGASTERYDPIPKYYKWYMLIFLWGAFFLNQGDRQLFGNVIKLIKDDMSFTDVQLGWVVTIFTIVYGIFVPIAGFAGDVIRKKLVVFLSLMLFSVGTLLTGFVPNSDLLLKWFPGLAESAFAAIFISLVLLIIIRSIATGMGEACYYPASNSLIGQYHSTTRATAMAVHQTANYTGVVFGGSLGAWVGFKFGWRLAFLTFGGIGILWAILILLLFRNDRKDFAQTNAKSAGNQQDDKVSARNALTAILSRPTFYCLALAFGGMCFVNVGYLTWMPKYLHEVFKLDGTIAAFNATFYHHLLAYVFVFVAAGISDRYAPKFKRVRILMEFIGLFFGAPFIYLMGATGDLLTVYIALAVFGLFRGIYDSNLFAAMFDVVEPKYRTTATGLMLSLAFIIGSFSPVVLAKYAERLGGNYAPGLSSLAIVYTASSLLILMAILFFYKKDRAAAEKNEL